MALLKLTEDNRKWWILAAMTTSISMIFIDISVLPVALPTLQRELNISDLGLQWVVNAYTLVLAVLVLAAGQIGDIWGLRKAFCFGICLFAIASALCGVSHSEWWMIMSRGLQGVGGAFMLPSTQGIIISHFPPHQRGKAVGLFVSIGSIFLALGPLIGGTLTTYVSWHYVFWINLPIAAAGLALTFYCLPPIKGSNATFDVRGFFILSTGITAFVFATMQAQHWGWASVKTLALLAIGIFSLVAVFKRKHKPHASILDFELMKKKSFFSSSTCILCNQMLLMVTVFWAIYFQNILGFSASTAGIYSFIANIPLLIAAPLAGFLVDRFGPRLPVVTGFGLIIFSLAWFLVFFRHESILLLMPTLLSFGFGVSMIFGPCFVALMEDVPAEKRGTASGINTAIRQFSASVGLALFGTVYSSVYFSRLGKFLLQNSQTESLSVQEFEGLLSKSPHAVQAVNVLPEEVGRYVTHSAKNSFLDAFQWMNASSILIAVVGIVIAWRMLKNHPAHYQK
jgi:EmrB/QacA subfamily drug resistance transporter